MKKIITKETVQRLVKDVKQIIKFPLTDNGIYYKHDESDILVGRAYIVGQRDTPYHGGNYFFRFQFPTDYPYRPPLVTLCTQGDKVRFNPNLYVNGKVCVSVLNTWAGEQWSSCQTICSVLFSLSTLLCANPLLNEPGVTTKHRDFDNYNQIIEYKNVDIAVMKVMNRNPTYFLSEFSCFDEEINAEFLKNKNDIQRFLELQHERYPAPVKLINHIFNMHCVLDYATLLETFRSLCNP